MDTIFELIILLVYISHTPNAISPQLENWKFAGHLLESFERPWNIQSKVSEIEGAVETFPCWSTVEFLYVHDVV